jgi:hypothetical protein
VGLLEQHRLQRRCEGIERREFGDSETRPQKWGGNWGRQVLGLMAPAGLGRRFPIYGVVLSEGLVTYYKIIIKLAEFGGAGWHFPCLSFDESQQG